MGALGVENKNCFHRGYPIGMSDMKSLREVFRLLQPKAIIPIHTENPEAFATEFDNEWKIIIMSDGDCFSAKD